MNTELRERLYELVDGADDEHGDWKDVVARAGIRRPRYRRSSILAFALLTLAVALFATPAFGLRDAVLGLIGRADVEFERGAPAPTVIRQQFEDLALGVPPSQDPQAIPKAMRRVGTFRLGGRDRTLWVGPTRRGGFCYGLERSGGGCLHADDVPAGRVALSYQSRGRPGAPVEAGPLQGWIFDDDAARITVEFEDESSADVPFTYVSAPIDAGFFTYDLPAQNRLEPHRPRGLVVYDAAGEELAREHIRYHREPLRSTTAPTPPQPLPAAPPISPKAPLQRATANGVTVTAGSNGAVIFDATEADAATAALLTGRRASYVCFAFRDGSARGYGRSGGFAPRVGMRYFGIDIPFDACEIQGSYGHVWPDRLDSHSAVELPFTVRAKRYFTDRAAARDLALFIRGRRVQEIRKRTGPALAKALELAFGGAIDRLPSADARPQVGRIGYWAGRHRTVFRELSPTGRGFEVEIVDGRIARENLGELAMVF